MRVHCRGLRCVGGVQKQTYFQWLLEFQNDLLWWMLATSIKPFKTHPSFQLICAINFCLPTGVIPYKSWQARADKSRENLSSVQVTCSVIYSRMTSLISTNNNYAVCMFSISAAALLMYRRRTNNRKKKGYFDNIWKPNSYLNEYFPPLPDEVVEVLRTSKLCYLATQSDGNPHLSLMNFTYCRKEEVIILSTRRNTKKYYQIVENPKVAVLIHDFPVEIVERSPSGSCKINDEENKNAKQWSITLNGVAEVGKW